MSERRNCGFCDVPLGSENCRHVWINDGEVTMSAKEWVSLLDTITNLIKERAEEHAVTEAAIEWRNAGLATTRTLHEKLRSAVDDLMEVRKTNGTQEDSSR